MLLTLVCFSATAGDRKQSQLLVFVSTSMNESLIKHYHAEATKYGGALVLRGLIDGSFQKSLNFIAKLGIENGAILIDDEAFERYEVKQVPAIVLAKGQGFDKISGSISVVGALKKFAETGSLGR